MGIKINKYNLGVGSIIFIGFFLRVYAYLVNPSMWHDECAIAVNVINKSYAGLFGVLDYLQVAPPFFTVATKFLTKIFGYSELVFRFIPLVAGCLSIFAFYLLSEKVLKSKCAILVSLFLFCVNNSLIGYSIEFKPYILDVFFTIVCLLFFLKLDIEKVDLKKLFFYGCLFALIPWFSFAPMFVIGACFLHLLIDKYKENIPKKIALILPVAIGIVAYLIFYMYTNYTKSNMVGAWELHNSFASLNFMHNLGLVIKGIRGLFSPVDLILFFLVFFIWGLVLFYKEDKKTFTIFSSIWVLPLIASFFKLYPYSTRLILFVVPIYILCITKPLELLDKSHKVKSSLIIFFFTITMFFQTGNIIKYVIWANYSKPENARGLLGYMKTHIKKDDIIYVNLASNVQFIYYNRFYNIKNPVVMANQRNLSMIITVEDLSKYKKGNYWFYFTWDKTPQEWDKIYKLPSVKIMYEQKSGVGRLVYLQIK